MNTDKFAINWQNFARGERPLVFLKELALICQPYSYVRVFLGCKDWFVSESIHY